MTTKNIVNIQDNKLDFYINGTNRFDVTLRGTKYLSVNEEGHIIAQQNIAITTNSKSVTNYDFLGHISNIDNHDLENLGDVEVTSLAPDQLLQYDGTNWINVDKTTVGATQLNLRAGDNDVQTISLIDDKLSIIGTSEQITTAIAPAPASNGTITVGLVDNVVVPTTLTVGSNGSSAKIKNNNGGTGFILSTKDANESTEIVLQHSSGETTINSRSDNSLNFAINGDVKAFVAADDFYVKNDLFLGTVPSEEGHASSSLIRCSNDGSLELIDVQHSNYEHYTYGTNSGIHIYTPIDFTVNTKSVSGGTSTPRLVVGSTETTVKNNLIVNGDIQVKGKSTILNTEVKLIEDPLIELNYVEGTYSGSSDIGFFGRYSADNNYTGFLYDTSESNFKVFDSMSSNAYSQEMKTIEPTNIRYVPILAKTFEVEGGYVGKDVYDLEEDVGDITSTSTINVETELLSYYNDAQGMYCGRLIAYSYGGGYVDHAITTINYNLVKDSNGGIKLIATVDAEIKRNAHNYLSYDETNKTISYTPPTDASTNKPVVKFRILPILTLN